MRKQFLKDTYPYTESDLLRLIELQMLAESEEDDIEEEIQADLFKEFGVQ